MKKLSYKSVMRSMVLDVFLLIIYVTLIFAKVGNNIVWIVLLIGDILISLPGDIRLLKKLQVSKTD